MAGGNLSITITGDAAQMNAVLESVGRKGKAAGDKVAKSMGGIGDEIKKAIPMVGALTTGAGAFLSVTNKIKEGWADILETQKQAAQRNIGSADAQARAIALARNPEEAKQIQRFIDEFRRKTGATGEQAGMFAFSAMSRRDALGGDLPGILSAFSDLANTKLVSDLGQTTNDIADVAQAFGTQAELTRNMAVLAAAADSSSADIGQLSTAMGELSATSAAVGTDFDTLAATLAKTTGGSIDVVKTRVQNVLTDMARRGYQGDIVSFAEQFRGMSAQELSKEFPNVRAMFGIQNILASSENIRSIQSDLRNINNQNASGVLAAKLNNLAATRAGQSAEMQRQVEQQKLAEEQTYGTTAEKRELLIRQRQLSEVQAGNIPGAITSTVMGNVGAVSMTEAGTAAAMSYSNTAAYMAGGTALGGPVGGLLGTTVGILLDIRAAVAGPPTAVPEAQD